MYKVGVGGWPQWVLIKGAHAHQATYLANLTSKAPSMVGRGDMRHEFAERLHTPESSAPKWGLQGMLPLADEEGRRSGHGGHPLPTAGKLR